MKIVSPIGDPKIKVTLTYKISEPKLTKLNFDGRDINQILRGRVLNVAGIA